MFASSKWLMALAATTRENGLAGVGVSVCSMYGQTRISPVLRSVRTKFGSEPDEP